MRKILWMILVVSVIFSIWGLVADKAMAEDSQELPAVNAYLYPDGRTSSGTVVGVTQGQVRNEPSAPSQSADYESQSSSSSSDSED